MIVIIIIIIVVIVIIIQNGLQPPATLRRTSEYRKLMDTIIITAQWVLGFLDWSLFSAHCLFFPVSELILILNLILVCVL